MSLENIHITRWGSGQPVVMVHGSAQGGPAGGAAQWADQRPMADRGWELVLPDRPGHGKSPSRGPEDLELDAVWVAELLGDGAHLVGHSYGGATALCAAGLRPEAVRSLTLVETPIFSVAPERPEIKAFRARVARATDSRSGLLGILRLMRAVNIPVRELGPPTPNLRDLVRTAGHFKTMRPPDTWDASAAIARVHEADVPFLAVTGGWSPGFAAIADELVAILGGEHLVIAAGHHFPQIAGNPRGAEFNAALLSFLSTSERDAKTQ